MSRKIIYLINPVSGTKKKDQLKDLIIRKTRAEGIEFEIYPSKADGSYDNLEKVIKKDGITDVVICGGDGTVNAVVNALQGVPVNFGIIPMGSGNGLAFAAKIPKQASLALDVIFKGKAIPDRRILYQRKILLHALRNRIRCAGCPRICKTENQGPADLYPDINHSVF